MPRAEAAKVRVWKAPAARQKLVYSCEMGVPPMVQSWKGEKGTSRTSKKLSLTPIMEHGPEVQKTHETKPKSKAPNNSTILLSFRVPLQRIEGGFPFT